MKNTFLGILALIGVTSFGTSAFAHGSIAHQASEAVESATKLFSAQQPKEVTRQFHSVLAESSGVERFHVTITLADQKSLFQYDCSENEVANPVVWECE